MSKLTVFLAAFGSLAFAACGAGAGVTAASDAGDDSVSIGASDAAPADASPTTSTSGSDASSSDGGSDAPISDAAWSPALVTIGRPCSDTVDSVYVTPKGLPPLDADHRGDVVACAADGVGDSATVAGWMKAKGVSFDGTASGVSMYRVSFRTFRSSGAEALSSAKVWLPTAPLPGPLPVVIVAHPTEGMADSCATSKFADHNQDLALPLAAHGWAVISADYAGLGTDGVQGYLDQRDTAQSLLDSARALRKLLPSGALSSEVIAVGYSQGGGAVLAAHGLAPTYGAGGTLAAVVAYAPEWQGRLNSFRFIDMLRDPTALTISYGITYPVVAAMRFYGHYANTTGAAPGTGIDSGVSSQLVNAMGSLCLKEFGATLQGYAPHLSDLFDDTFRKQVLACVDGKSGCTADGAAFVDWLRANEVMPDPHGPPILYVQGLADTIMEPAHEAACNVTRLSASGASFKLCTDSTATHTDIAPRNASMAIGWIDAMLAGKEPPACGTDPLPTCVP